MEKIYEEMELYKLFLNDYLDLYVYFCGHLRKRPADICNEVLFKEEFNFERWKKGFVDYKQNKLIDYVINNKIDGVKLQNKHIQLTYNCFRSVPFNIKYKLI